MLTTVAGNVIWELASSRLQGFQMNIPRNETIRLNRTLYKHQCFQSERLEFSDLTLYLPRNYDSLDAEKETDD